MTSMASEAENEKVREMLTLDQVLAMIPFDRTFLFRLESEHLFPQGHFISARKRLWFRDEVAKWQRDLADPESELSKAVRQKLPKNKGE
jgi:predicted DNA-binding transcriptional regulator AlpA